MFCTNCGKEIENDSKFCVNCGARVNSLKADDEALPKNDKPEASRFNAFDDAKRNSVNKENLYSTATNPNHDTRSLKNIYIFGFIILLIGIILFLVFFTSDNSGRDNGNYSRKNDLETELRNLQSTKDIDGLDNFIRQHSGTEFGKRAEDIKSDLMNYFRARQPQFESRQKEFGRQYINGMNDVARSNTFNESNKWSASFMKEDNYRFYDWHGTLLTLSTTKGGNEVRARINSDNIIYKVDLTSSSPAYAKLAGVETWKMVRFSGVFRVGGDGLLVEDSMTEVGKMLNPEFKIQLTDISMDVSSARANEQSVSGNEVPETDSSNDSENIAEETIKPSFDCKRATTAAERLICSSKALADTDVQMAQSYKAVMSRTANKQALKREQLAWLKNERDVCTDEDAMLKVYQERIEQLSTR
jgi:uncharacterized protein YecT (DUF1311 family)